MNPIINHKSTSKFIPGTVYADIISKDFYRITFLQFIKYDKFGDPIFKYHSGRNSYFKDKNKDVIAFDKTIDLYPTNLKPNSYNMKKPKKRNYFDTTRLPKKELTAAIRQATLQDKRVIKIFKLKRRPLTPAEVWTIYCKMYPACPITSIRRSITYLTDANKLVNTGKKKPGLYKQPNHIWRLK